MPNACDYSMARPSPNALAEAGIVGVVRYATRFGFDAAEFAALQGAGLAVAMVMEWGSQPALRGMAGGTNDAQEAEASAAQIGYPPTCAIYYVAEDPNVLPQSEWPTVAAYFQAVKAVNPSRPLGAYGSQPLVAYLQSLGLVTYGWMVTTWSNVVSGMHLCQMVGGVPSQFNGQIDIDVVLQDDWGQHPHPVPPTPTPPPLPAGVSMAQTCVFNTTDKNQQVFYVDASGVLHHHYWSVLNTEKFPTGWSPDEPLGGGWLPGSELEWAQNTAGIFQVWGMLVNGGRAQCYLSPSSHWVTQPL